MKLTLTSNTDQPVIRVDNFKAGSPVYGSIEFTPGDLRQLNAFAATCPMFVEKCIGNDPTCPCQDGDQCHYKGENPWPIKGDV